MYCDNHSCFQGDVFSNFHWFNQFCSWKANSLLGYRFEYRNWVFWVAYLGHIFWSNGDIWLCYKICAWRGCSICETTMRKNCWSIITELQGQFPTQDLMDAFGFVCTPNISYNQNLNCGFFFTWQFLKLPFASLRK